MNIRQRIEEEDKWQFNHFDHDDALEIGLSIIKNVKQNKLKGVSIQIVYDDLIVFHHLMKGRKESPWLERKVKTVMDSKHSSLYVYYASHENNEYAEWQTDSEYAISGGGFPIIEQGIVKGAICVSGLDHLEDHKLIIEALTSRLS